ncbi:Golgi transport complex subunit 6 [Blyttiomyces sp. JEL0837]|nr:Golgi transport complex subunit 6 [Blyttiomyces sp. JEL0837]
MSRGQAVAIMRTINALLVDSTLQLRSQMLSHVDVENETYLYKNHLQELRNELQLLRQNETGSLKTDVEQIIRDLDGLNQKLAERIAGLKADVAMDINNHKTEGRDVGTKTDLKIQEIHNKLVIELSSLKTRIETLKMEATRQIVWVALLSFALQPQSKLPKTHPLSQKLQKILSSSFDDNATQEALETLTKFSSANTPSFRRNLRGDIERRSNSLNASFLAVFDDVSQQLLIMEDDMHQLNASFGEMESKLQGAQRETSVLMRQTTELKEKRTCVDEICHIRQNAIVRNFLQALTHGGPNGLPRPIELHAHDPLRYCGDILAWLHQCTVSERELLEGLFDLGDQDGLPPLSGLTGEAVTATGGTLFSHEQDLILVIIDKGMERTCRPFKVRMEEVLASNVGVIEIYKLASLVDFYGNMISKVIGKTSQLSQAVEEISEKAFVNFYESLKIGSKAVVQSLSVPRSDLQPPPELKDSLGQIKQLLSIFEDGVAEKTDDSFGPVLNAVLDPLLQLFREGTIQLSPYDRAIFAANCLSIIELALGNTISTEDWVEKVRKEIDAQVKILEDEEYHIILLQSGLLALLEALDENNGKVGGHNRFKWHPILIRLENQIPLSRVPQLDAKVIAGCMSNFDIFLCTAGFDSSSRLSKLLSPTLARRAMNGGFKSFLQAYSKLYDAIMDPASKYEFPATLVSRTVGEIETLLDITTL